VADGDFRVDISYITYKANADSCGDWSKDLSFTMENDTSPNFGCAVQHNIAAMVADPRDLVTPRGFETADGKRAATVIDNYEQGKPTAAQKTQDQSGAVSDVNKQ
jgi:pilus assembly protein CpaD